MNKDPILAMIVEHRRIGKALCEASQHVKHPDDNPLQEPYLDATIRLYKTTPTTIAGAIALLESKGATGSVAMAEGIMDTPSCS
jgi:hypothetical protein